MIAELLHEKRALSPEMAVWLARLAQDNAGAVAVDAGVGGPVGSGARHLKRFAGIRPLEKRAA